MRLDCLRSYKSSKRLALLQTIKCTNLKDRISDYLQINVLCQHQSAQDKKLASDPAESPVPLSTQFRKPSNKYSYFYHYTLVFYALQHYIDVCNPQACVFCSPVLYLNIK